MYKISVLLYPLVCIHTQIDDPEEEYADDSWFTLVGVPLIHSCLFAVVFAIVALIFSADTQLSSSPAVARRLATKLLTTKLLTNALFAWLTSMSVWTVMHWYNTEIEMCRLKVELANRRSTVRHYHDVIHELMSTRRDLFSLDTGRAYPQRYN